MVARCASEGPGSCADSKREGGSHVRMIWLSLALAAGIVLLAATRAADKDQLDQKTGIKVGEKAPTFALKDQSGKERKVEEFLKIGKVAIVFHRSASW